MSTPPLDLDTASLDDVKRLVRSLAEEMGRLRAENAGLREEIARLKGLPAKPKLKPSGMEKKTERAEVKRRRKQKRRGAKALAETVTETRVIAAAPPAGISGHFGPELRRFVLAQYHQGQTTVERLTALLCDLGGTISKRQVVRLLTAGAAPFVAEADGVLAAGLETARFDAIFTTRTGFATLDRLLARIHADRDDLLRVLDHPDIPLHTNGRKTTSAARSPAARLAAAPAAKMAKTRAMPCSACSRPAANSGLLPRLPHRCRRRAPRLNPRRHPAPAGRCPNLSQVLPRLHRA